MRPIVYYQGIELYTFSLMMMLAIVACILILFFSKKTCFVSKIKKYDYCFIFFATLPSFFGGKAIYAFVQFFINGYTDIKMLLNGFVFYGGLLGFELGIWLYCRFIKIDFFEVNDPIIMVFPLGQSIGRIGCYFNGCCYGKKTNSVMGIKYIIDGKSVRVYPTWFMESVGCFLIFCILYYLYGKFANGIETTLYFAFYPVMRFCIEFFRGDTIRGYVGMLSISQWICILIIIVNFFQFRLLEIKSRIRLR